MFNKYKIYGSILYYVTLLLEKTLTIVELNNEKFISEKPYIFCAWHNKLLLAMFCFRNISKTAVLASPSNDGELISVPFEKRGFTVVRGSSNQKKVSSLINLLKLVKKGYSIGTPVDGPKGPIYKVKPGLIFIAQKSGVEIMPLGMAYSKKWVFNKAWDKFQLPKPFSKAYLVCGEPIKIEKNDDIDEVCIMLEKILIDLDNKAERIKNGEDY